jgi:hypothetical protein
MGVLLVLSSGGVIKKYRDSRISLRKRTATTIFTAGFGVHMGKEEFKIFIPEAAVSTAVYLVRLNKTAVTPAPYCIDVDVE